MIRSQVRLALCAAVLGLGLVWAGQAAAQTAEEPPVPAQARPHEVPRPSLLEFGLSRDDGRGPFALLVGVGAYSGLGGGIAVGTRDGGLRASVGWSPTLAFLMSGSETDVHVYSSLVVAPDVYARLLRPRPTTDVGLQGGYRYSSLYGHGGAAGAYVEFALGRSLDALVTGGLVFYPGGEDRLRKDQNLPSSTSFSFPGPAVNLGINLGLAFFP